MGRAMVKAQAARAALGADVLSIGTPSSSVAYSQRVEVDRSPAAASSVAGSAVRVQRFSPELQRAMKTNFSVSLMSWKLTETLQRNEALQQEVCVCVHGHVCV